MLDYPDGGKWTLVHESTEIESGKRNDKLGLGRGMAACKKHRARLVIAKLNRLWRNLAFIATLMGRKADFLCCGNPAATKLTIHILVASTSAT